LRKFKLFIGLAATNILLLIGINLSNVIEPLEETFLDSKFRVFQRNIENPDVALLMIDEQSLFQVRDELGIYWPWPREIYSYVHNYLSLKGAKAIGYDIIFDQPDFNRTTIQGSVSDQSFETSLQTFENGILALYADKTEVKNNKDYGLSTYKIEGYEDKDFYEFKNLPISRFRNAAKSIGSISITSVNETSIRRASLFFQSEENEYLPSFPVATFLAPINSKHSFFYKDGLLSIDSLDIPLNSDNEYLINWYRQGGGGLTDGSFNNYSFVSVLKNAIQYAHTGSAPEDSLISIEGKYVLVGASAAGLSDIKSTPMSPLEPFPGVEIHATILQNLAAGDFIKVIEPDNWSYRLIMLVLVLFLIYVIVFQSYRYNIFCSLLMSVGIVIVGLLLFKYERVWFPTVESFLYLCLPIGLGYITKYVTEDKEKRRLRLAFSRYVQKELVDKISDDPSMLKLGGQRKELTIIFSDLEGFTGISERYSAEELVAFLNEYLTKMTGIVFEQNGTLDKYIGDAIMAFWGAPLNNDDHAYYACKCVLEMQKSLYKLHNKWESEGKPTPIVRFGVNTGEAIVGNMGSQDRFDYTVMGDQVNLAARLEPANKDFGTKVLISESTYRKVEDRFICREAGKIKAKGKEEIIRVYELLDEVGAPKGPEFASFLDAYEKALHLYYKKELDEAASLFIEIQKNYGYDALIDTYLSRIAHYQAFPPEDDWTGVHEQISK
jgi:adenylate cyclase